MSEHSIADARNNLSRLIDRALAGEDVTITRRGAPVVKLTPEKKAIGSVIDPEWIRRHRITLKSGSDFSWADVIRQMRDEGY